MVRVISKFFKILNLISTNLNLIKIFSFEVYYLYVRILIEFHKKDWQKIKILIHKLINNLKNNENLNFLKIDDGKKIIIKKKNFLLKDLYKFKTIKFEVLLAFLYSTIESNFKSIYFYKRLLAHISFKMENDQKAKNEILIKYKPLKIIVKKKKQDKEFYNYCKKASIAVVGPAENDIENGNQIDNFDIVVRTNYNSNYNLPKSIYGSKTNVSYYNSFRVRNYLDDVTKISNKIEWMIFKSYNDNKKYINFSKKNNFNLTNSRIAISPNKILFLSESMSLQIILNDLLNFKAKEIKLFNFDFYAKSIYHKDYKNFDKNLFKVSESLRLHESIGCFSFIKSLYNKQLFEADELTSKILNYSTKQYVNKLDNLYGKINLK